MLIGRNAERAVIAALLAEVKSSRGGALIVRGVPGSGKSTLLADAISSASGMTVLRTQGVESESPLAFAALQRLLWPLRGRLDRLPAPQRAALRAALGETDEAGDRFRTFLGTLSLLAAAAEDSPVLAVIDDAQWLDDASAAALLFVARRLDAERIGLVFAARDVSDRRFAGDDLPALTLNGVGGAVAEQLLDAHGAGGVDPSVRDRLVSGTGGNPLALVELAGVLTADQMAGREPLPAPLPLTGGVERAFAGRYRQLSAGAQWCLLVAAADDSARLTVVRAAAERVAGGDALDEAERAGLVRVDGDALTWHHPLMRSAVYAAAGSTQRRSAHRVLADAPGLDHDRRTWHLAAAADRPDATVVAALDAVGERAAARGGHEAAAAAWSRAAELTADGPGRGRRLYRAAAAHWLGANPSRAAALASAASTEITDHRTRVQLLMLQGHIEAHTRSLDDGYRLMLDAAQLAADGDMPLAHQPAMVTAAFAAFGAHSTPEADLAALLTAPAPDAPAADHAAAALLSGYLAVARRDWAAAVSSFRRAFAITEARPSDDQQALQPNLGLAAMLVDDDERGLRLHAQHLTAARRAGDLTWVEHALTRGMHAQLATGAWAQAAASAVEALQLVRSTGRPGLAALPTATLAVLAALRGNDDADQLLRDVAAIREAHPVGVSDNLVLDLTRWTAGLRAARQPATALHHLQQITGPPMRRLASLDLFEAAVRSGCSDVARDWLDELDRFASATGSASAVAAGEHGRALLADGAAAEEHFHRALAAHGESPRRPDLARTRLAFGEHLRRARRRLDAREHLRGAFTLFDDLGAAPSAERAAQELRASGETARRRDVSSATELTPQERQVTVLIRQGLSTRDAAAQLFVSPRTVDFHLRNVFVKLGVSSRAELAALALD